GSFFCQGEGGIGDWSVTGVQTCALPISKGAAVPARLDAIDRKILKELQDDGRITNVELASRVGISAPPCLRRVRGLEEAGYIKRSEERRVGKEGRARGARGRAEEGKRRG